MHALVTGGTGFVGRRLVGELLGRNWTVRVAARHPFGAQAGECIEVCEVGELSASTDWRAALRGIDVVFHLAAHVHQVGRSTGNAGGSYRRVNAEASAALAGAAIDAGVGHFVFVSSVKAMGEVSARPFRETDPPQPQDPYGRSKLEAECLLGGLAGPMRVAIVRPPLVYGPDVRANFLSLLKLAASGWPLPLGAARSLRSMVFIENLVDALIACATRPLSVPSATYFVADSRDLSVAELVGTLRAEMGLPPRLWAVPAGLVQVAGRLAGRSDVGQRLFSPLQVDSSRIRAELRWTPPFSPEEGLRRTVRWFMQEGRRGAS
jgi:nucleoside-diphosphate-sugar epimerase